MKQALKFLARQSLRLDARGALGILIRGIWEVAIVSFVSALLLGTGSAAFTIIWLYFVYWFIKNKKHEISTTYSVLSELERLDSEGLNPSLRRLLPVIRGQSTEFARSRIYTTITGAGYHDEKSFVESVSRARGTEISDSFADRTAPRPETQTEPSVESRLDEQLSMTRVSLEDYSLGLKLQQLCGISGDLIQRNEFDINDRESCTLPPASKHEVVVTHRETGLEIVLPKRTPDTGVETKFVGFLNDVLKQKRTDGKFFVDGRHATFATPEQMYVLLDILDVARATAPRYCCISAELRTKT